MSLSIVKSHKDLKEINLMIKEISNNKNLSKEDILVIDLSKKVDNSFSGKMKKSLLKKDDERKVISKKHTI